MLWRDPLVCKLLSMYPLLTCQLSVNQEFSNSSLGCFMKSLCPLFNVHFGSLPSIKKFTGFHAISLKASLASFNIFCVGEAHWMGHEYLHAQGWFLVQWSECEWERSCEEVCSGSEKRTTSYCCINIHLLTELSDLECRKRLWALVCSKRVVSRSLRIAVKETTPPAFFNASMSLLTYSPCLQWTVSAL